MRRTELLDAVKEVIQALTESDLYKVFREQQRKPSSELKAQDTTARVLTSLKEYSLRANIFSPAARELVEIFGLDAFDDPEFWAAVVSEGGRISPRLVRSLDMVVEQLPKVLRLIQPEALRVVSESADGEHGTPNPYSLLSVILIEDKNRFSSPARLVEILQSISSLYEASAVLLDIPGERLSVVACDSGSDKSFDFLGAAKVMECVTQIILSVWDRVVFYREKQIAQRIELIASALPVMDQIGTLEKDNKLGREQAELLRRKLVDGVSKFIESGAIIPEIQERSYFNPRALMAPEPKLLVSAPTEESPHFHGADGVKADNRNLFQHDPNIDSLDEDERQELMRLLEKTRHGKQQGLDRADDKSEDMEATD